MSKLWSKKLSRRRLLGSAALGTAALPVLHETVPHQGVHDSLASAGEAGHGDHGGTNGAHKGSGHRGAVGKVDHARQRLRPHRDPARLRRGPRANGVREWEIVAEDKEIEVAPGVKYAAWTYNGRVPGPTLRAREGERLRINFVNASHAPAHDALPRHPPRRARRHPGHRRRATSRRASRTVYEFDAEPFGLHHYHCHSTPLADHIAKGLYGMFIVDPKQGRPQADELVMVMNGFDTNFDRSNEVYAVNTVAFAYEQRADPGQARRAGADLPPEHPRVRPPELVPHPRELLRRLPDRHVAGAHRADRHGRPGPGPARDPRAALPVHGQVHVPRPRDASSRSSAGWASSRWSTDGGPERTAPRGARARRAGSPGLLPLVAARRGHRRCSSRSTRPASSATACRSRSSRWSAPCCARARSSCTCATTAPTRWPSAGDRQRRLRPASPRASDELGPARRRRDPRRSTRGSRARPTRWSCSPPPAATIDHTIEAAAETPDADAGFFGLMALIGLYVGVIPVAIGMLWLPWLRRIDPRWVQFLHGADGRAAGLPRASTPCSRAPRSRATGAAGVRRRGAGVAGRGGRLPGAGGRRRAGCAGRERAGEAGGRRARGGWRFLVALGIGLHNLGEGLAIGSAYAVGSLALGAALVVGFALHNTTEGLAIVAPVAKGEEIDGATRLKRLVLLGAARRRAGDPRRVHRRLGLRPEPGRVHVRPRRRGDRPGDRPDRAQPCATRRGQLLHPLAVGGLLTGLALMYVTGLLVSV